MAKFDRKEWERRMKNEMADEIAGEAAAAARAAQDDAQLKKELTEMFGSSDYDAIIKAVGASEGYSDREIRAMQKAAKRAKEKLNSNHPNDAIEIIKSNKGLNKAHSAYKRNKKGCAVITVLLLTIGGSSAAAAIYGAAEVISAMMH